MVQQAIHDGPSSPNAAHPSAAVASLMASGLTATAMYARVEALENELDAERRERVRVTSHLNAVLREVWPPLEVAPLVRLATL
jgi:hypothetical protein